MGWTASRPRSFLEANRRAAELLGYSKKELVGMIPLHIQPKEDTIPVDITGSPVKDGGRTLVQGIFRDITDPLLSFK
jgi:PAS domain-containing protein